MLYAPFIDTIVPAFTGNTVEINFQHNTAVLSGVKGMCLMIRKLNNDRNF